MIQALQSNETREALRHRFTSNMRRIGSVATLLQSGVEDLRQKVFGTSEGVRAEINRALIVFLHATFEDLIRSNSVRPNKAFTFSSASDIRHILVNSNIDPGLFTDLFPSLTQMARRRNRIVHHADLTKDESQIPSPWTITDDWQLIHWHLTVSAFYHRLRRATGPTGLVEERASQNVENTLLKNVEFARELIKFPDLSPDQLIVGVEQLVSLLENMQKSLHLDINSFIGPDGQPLEGAI